MKEKNKNCFSPASSFPLLPLRESKTFPNFSDCLPCASLIHTHDFILSEPYSTDIVKNLCYGVSSVSAFIIWGFGYYLGFQFQEAYW